MRGVLPPSSQEQSVTRVRGGREKREKRGNWQMNLVKSIREGKNVAEAPIHEHTVNWLCGVDPGLHH